MFSRSAIATFALVGYSHAVTVEYPHNPYPAYNKLKNLTYAFQATVEESINCFYEDSSFAINEEWWCSLFLTRTMDQLRIGLSEIANSYDCYAWDN